MPYAFKTAVIAHQNKNEKGKGKRKVKCFPIIFKSFCVYSFPPDPKHKELFGGVRCKGGLFSTEYPQQGTGVMLCVWIYREKIQTGVIQASLTPIHSYMGKGEIVLQLGVSTAESV